MIEDRAERARNTDTSHISLVLLWFVLQGISSQAN